MKNKTLAIEAAPAAIPPKPNTAAMIAIIKNVTVQRNIILKFGYLICIYFKYITSNDITLQAILVLDNVPISPNIRQGYNLNLEDKLNFILSG